MDGRRKPYRPSNGTEGEAFMERYCYKCGLAGDLEEGPQHCDIMDRAWVYEVDDPRYPKEWTIIGADLRTAKCSAFTTEPPKERICPVCRGLGLINARGGDDGGEKTCNRCRGKGAVWVTTS